MFTGIIEEVGKIKIITNSKISISAKKVLEDVKIGDSIAVNGVCLTVSKFDKDSFEADVSPETYNVTAFRYLKSGDEVNLERALCLNSRLGGHIVSGHIDGTARVSKIEKKESFYNLFLEINSDNAKYVVKKGSIALNGISLTIAKVDNLKIEIAVIPHTYENTSLKNLKYGDFVNIETDIISKYIEKFLSTSDNRTGIDMDFLLQNGFQ